MIINGVEIRVNMNRLRNLKAFMIIDGIETWVNVNRLQILKTFMIIINSIEGVETTKAQFVQKVRNIDPRQKFTGFYREGGYFELWFVLTAKVNGPLVSLQVSTTKI